MTLNQRYGASEHSRWQAGLASCKTLAYKQAELKKRCAWLKRLPIRATGINAGLLVTAIHKCGAE